MYNAGIILQGQNPSMFDGFQQGQQVGRQNALANLYKTQGAGIANGDQNALNALAQFDPQAAMSARASNFDFQQAQVAARQQAEEYKRSVSAAEAAATAAEVEKAVKMGLSARTPEEWDGMVSQFAPDLVGQFENRDMIAQSYMSVADVMKQRASAGDRFKVVGNRVVDLTAEGGPKSVFDAGTQESGTVVYDPTTGNPIVSTGTAKPVKLTEGQSKDLVYFERATGASPIIDEFGESLTSFAQKGLNAVPGVGNALTSDEFQKANQAAAEWLAAILRKDTGAAITSQEFDIYGPMYLPTPGDGAEVLAQKKEARKRAEAAIKRGLGTAEVIANEMLAQRGSTETGAPVNSPQPGGTGPDQGYQLTPEDDALLRKYGGGN